MTEKNIKSRIIHKHDSETNWLKATNFIPMQGELIVYDRDDNYDYERFKIGDGITNVNALPFAGSDVDLTDYATKDDVANQDAVVLAEAQAYADNAITEAKVSGEFDGADGYTPIRGTDYWTDADKAEIKSYVDDAILNGAW